MIDDIKEKLIEVSVALKGEVSNRIWTTEIKRNLYHLANEKYKYKVATSGFVDICDAERLWDLTWFRNDEKILEIALIAEIEWSPHLPDIIYDFEKLIMGRAALRLMVFPGTKETIKELVDIAKKSALSQSGDNYLFEIGRASCRERV